MKESVQAGEFSCLLCDRDFDTKHARGLHFGKGHSQEEKREALIEEVHRVADLIGQPPSVSRMKKHGRAGRDAFESVFGSWSNALNAAGLQSAPGVEHTHSELIEELQRVGDVLGKTPTRNKMREHGEIGTSCYYNRFGSWNSALVEAGFEVNEVHKHDREELLAELLRLEEELGCTPKRDQMRNQGKFHSDTYRRKFGSWNAALEEAGLEANFVHNIPEEDLLEAIAELAKEVGGTPTAKEMTLVGKYSSTLYQNRFGSWNEAVEKAGLEPNLTEGRRRIKYGIGWTEKKKERIRERDGFECWSCSLTQEQHQRKYGTDFHVHHLIPAGEFSPRDPRANMGQNLLTLCLNCHKKWEWARSVSPDGEELPPECDPPDIVQDPRITDYR